MTRYAAVCCRLSPRPDGSYEGVDVQERLGRDYAANAWPDLPVEVFADRGISAANGDRRPEHERFRQWVRDGLVARVWCVEQSRLERREVEWFQLAAELDAAGITEVHTNRDGIVRVRDEVAGIKAVLAAGERRKMLARQSDTFADHAARGLPPGSRPFGYVHARDADGRRTYEVVPAQAEAIRDAAAMVLAGWSLSAVVAELRSRGLRGGHGGEIGVSTVRGMLTSPTVAGLRVHSGRVVGNGNWPAILDEDTFHACRRKLEQSRRVKRTDGGSYPVGASQIGSPTGRRYLLTGGLVACGVCGAPLVGTEKQLRNKSRGVFRKPYLVCHPNRGGRGCIGIMLPEVERHVVDELFAELDKPEFLDAIAAGDHDAERERLERALDAINGQREQLAAMWATPGELTMAEWQTARRTLTETEQALRAELAAVPPPVVDVDIAAARDAWDDGMTLDEQREFLRLFIERVTIRRAVPGTKGFDDNRVRIQWRTEYRQD